MTFGIVLLALLGGYALRFHRFGVAVPKFVTGLLTLLGVATVVIGLLFGYVGYNAHFHRNNRVLDDRLVKMPRLSDAWGGDHRPPGSRPPRKRPDPGWHARCIRSPGDADAARTHALG